MAVNSVACYGQQHRQPAPTLQRNIARHGLHPTVLRHHVNGAIESDVGVVLVFGGSKCSVLELLHRHSSLGGKSGL